MAANILVDFDDFVFNGVTPSCPNGESSCIEGTTGKGWVIAGDYNISSGSVRCIQ